MNRQDTHKSKNDRNSHVDVRFQKILNSFFWLSATKKLEREFGELPSAPIDIKGLTFKDDSLTGINEEELREGPNNVTFYITAKHGDYNIEIEAHASNMVYDTSWGSGRYNDPPWERYTYHKLESFDMDVEVTINGEDAGDLIDYDDAVEAAREYLDGF